MKLSSHAIKIHPSLLRSLQRIYLAKNKVVNNISKQEQEIFPVFNEVNFYGNGQGNTVLNKLNELFGLEKQNILKKNSNLNQLVNTSLHDATYLTCIVELKALKKEIDDFVVCLKNKRDTFGKDEVRITRGLKIDQTVHSFFNNYINALEDFDHKIEYNIKVLENNLPLSSTIQSTTPEVVDFINKNKTAENDEKLFSELKNSFSLSSNFDKSCNRLEKIGDTMPVKNTASLTSELASVLMKFANDIRFVSSGPRSGFGEMTIPENEPGSSIMPGKVNPTQCESMTMLCSQVLGNTNAVLIASSSSMFEGNCFLPLIANNTVRSLVLLSDGIRSFRTKCMEGAEFIKHQLDLEVKNFRI